MFNAFGIADIGDQSNPYVYPSTNAVGDIISEEWDNGLKNVIVPKCVFVERSVKGQPSKYEMVLDGGEIKYKFYVTDSRAIFLCDKYDKGGGYIGMGVGAAVALAANAVSKMNAAARSKGTVLLGHIRYEWLTLIQYRYKKGWLDSDTLQLYYEDDEKTWWCISVSFEKGTDIDFIANNILQRACKYRLAMNDEKGEKEMAFFTKYADGDKITLNSDRKQFNECYFPNYYVAPRGENKRPTVNRASGNTANSTQDVEQKKIGCKGTCPVKKYDGCCHGECPHVNNCTSICKEEPQSCGDSVFGGDKK